LIAETHPATLSNSIKSDLNCKFNLCFIVVHLLFLLAQLNAYNIFKI
jgi:hypothetical protein